MSDTLKPIAKHLLKMYEGLFPEGPFADAESKLFANELGFIDNSIESRSLLKVLNESGRHIPQRDDYSPDSLAKIGSSFSYSLQSNQAKEYLDKYLNYVFDLDRGLMTCSLTENDNLDWLLSSLDALRKDNNWVLDTLGGPTMNLYVRPRDSIHPPVGPHEICDYSNKKYRPYIVPEEEQISPFEHIHLDFTLKALWQGYLLNITPNLIGTRGHGNYHRHRLVMNYSDLNYQGKNKEAHLCECRPVLEYLLGNRLNPTILTDTTHALISHYWINDWIGLYKTNMLVEYDQARSTITNWLRIDDKPIIQFDCSGMRY